jgi:hypothetical protein
MENIAQCLDLIHVTWTGDQDRACCDDAILLEVSRGGGLLHAGLTMPERLSFKMHTGVGKFDARVERSEYDGHGFVVRFKVTSRQWYPHGFQPANLKRVDVNNASAGHSKASHAA